MKKANNDVEYNYDSDFPRILRDLMKERGTTQDALAEICGVKRQSIAQWKDGNTRPDIVSLRKISEFYEVSTDYLLGLTPNPTTDEATKELCATLGLSEIAIDYLRNNENEHLRNVINFLFALHRKHDEFNENDFFENNPYEEPKPTENISILEELCNFLGICAANEDIEIDLDRNEVKIQHIDINSEKGMRIFGKSLDNSGCSFGVHGVFSLKEQATKNCISEISKVLDYISRESRWICKTITILDNDAETEKYVNKLYEYIAPILKYIRHNKENG